MRPSRGIVALSVLGMLVIAMVAGGLTQRGAGDIGSMDRAQTLGYIGYSSGAGLFYVLAIWLTQRQTLPWRPALIVVLAAAAAMRVLTLLSPPLLSTDIYRYVWDGRVQAAGINPYLYLPVDPALAGLRDAGAGPEAIYPNINRADSAPTIYPPAAQAIFAAISATWPTIWGVKAAMLAFDVLAVGAALLLLRAARMPLERVLIYAWNPLPVWEFAGGGHVDAAALALSALALVAAVRRRPAWAGAALSLAVLCKLLPAALFPAIWRRWDLRAPLVCAAMIAAGYACFAGAGWRVLGYLPGYASEERLSTGGGFFLLRLLGIFGQVPDWAGPAYVAIALAGLLALAAWVALRAPLPADPAARAIVICRDALWITAAVMAALSPHYPWYFTALAIPAVLVPVPSVLWLTLAAPVLYLDHGLEDVGAPAIVFIPFAILLARDLLRRRATPRPALAVKGS